MIVRLTDAGLHQLGGLRTNEQIRAQMRGVAVTAVSLAYTVPEVYNVDLAAPFERFLLTSCDV